jgi:O-antigen/teichoic acid export membrane protein
VQNVSVITEARAVKLELEKRVVRANLLYAILFLAIHIFLLYYGYSLPLLLVTLVILQIIKTLILLSSIHAEVAGLQPLNLGRQWLYLGLGEVLGIIYKWLDKWLILYFLSLSQFALYFNGSYEIPIFLVLISAVGNVMIVELSKRKLQPEKVRFLYTNTALLLAAIVFPAFSFLFFYHELFFILFFGEQYRAAIPIFLITIFVLPLRITNFTALLQALRRNDIVLQGIVFDLGSAIMLMIVLYPLWGTEGIAAAFVVSTYLQAAFYLWQTARVTGLPLTTFLPFAKLSVSLIFCLAATGLSYYLFIKYFLDYLLLVGVLVSLLLSIFFIALQRRWRRSIL